MIDKREGREKEGGVDIQLNERRLEMKIKAHTHAYNCIFNSIRSTILE